MEQSRKKRLSRLKNKYRLVIMHDESFEEKLSLRLTRLNVYTILGVTTIVLVTLGIMIVAFTPLKEYLVPGYTSARLRNQNIVNAMETDSLVHKMRIQQQYMDNFRSILRGEDTLTPDTSDVQPGRRAEYEKIEIAKSQTEVELIQAIESEDQFNLNFGEPALGINAKIDLLFICPLKGLITNGFDAESKHYGVDVVAKKNQAVKATLNGKVIMAGWTSETGYVIGIQHKNNLVSFYKHNSVLLKEAGDFVSAGEAIAIVGDSGELTSGPHLHFELWNNGNPTDPQDFIVF